MVPEIRDRFNREFSDETYRRFLEDLNQKHPGAIDFRVAETPVFIPRDFTRKIIDTCEFIIDIITAPDFKNRTGRAIPPSECVPGEDSHTDFIAFDFGICQNEEGGYEPQLIEMQGFPTLFGFQAYYPQVLERHFHIPDNYSSYLNGYDRRSYLQLLREIVVGDADPENVILLDIKPDKQKTRIDFYCTRDYLGIPVVCLTELKREGKKLYYLKEGRPVEVKRIYNRVIFDELEQVKGTLGDVVDLTQPIEATWVPHPNWFYRISKFTLPFIDHPYVPKTFFLDQLGEMPQDLENYVLKPLFSFAGQGVLIDVTQKDIENVADRQNWILQQKVNYAGVIKTPDVPAKAEIRIFYFWEKHKPRPVAVTNLARLSKGKMIGVRYNMNREWVGGSVAYFEK